MLKAETATKKIIRSHFRPYSYEVHNINLILNDLCTDMYTVVNTQSQCLLNKTYVYRHCRDRISL